MKINIGCGWRDFGKDWIHVDGGDYAHLDSKDINLPEYAPETVDLIYASHLIAYFDREEIQLILNNWKRVLKPSGILRIATPDFRKMASLYVKGYNDVELDSFLGPLYGKMLMNKDNIYHRTTYDLKEIKKVLSTAGFKNVRLYDWRDTEHSHFDDHSQAYIPHMDKENGTLISLNVECEK
tara:strand:+ start:33 stop:575 length:543 start_codon:yes stop_codon:yes gene_type:complete